MAVVPAGSEAVLTLVMALLGNLVNKGVLSNEDFQLIVAAANAPSGAPETN